MNELITAINKNNLDEVMKLCNDESINLNEQIYFDVSDLFTEEESDYVSFLEIAYLYRDKEVAMYILEQLFTEKYLDKKIEFNMTNILFKVFERRDIVFLKRFLQLNINGYNFSSSVIKHSLKISEIRDVFNEHKIYHKFHEYKCLYSITHDLETIDYLYNIGLNINKHENSFIFQYLCEENQNRIEVMKKMIDLSVYLIPCNLSNVEYNNLGDHFSNWKLILRRKAFVDLIKEMENFDDFNAMNNNMFR